VASVAAISAGLLCILGLVGAIMEMRASERAWAKIRREQKEMSPVYYLKDQ
jgi:hypothetical protein